MTVTIDPFREFLVSNYAQRVVKEKIAEDYENRTDQYIEAAIQRAIDEARKLPDADLLVKLDPGKGLSGVFRRLPRDKFRWEAYSARDLVTTLWVSDVPHEYTHHTFEALVSLAADCSQRHRAPDFFKKVYRLKSLSFLTLLPVLVVEPSASQRSKRRKHHVCSDDKSGPLCTVPYLEEGKAYIEDGNHRAVARQINQPDSEIKVIVFSEAS